MFECQKARPWRALVHADSPVRPQWPVNDGKMPATATAILPMLALATTLAVRLKIGLHLDGKLKEASVRAAVLR